jgi:type I restriction enzyme S subunit
MSDWQECKLGNITSKIGSGATPTGGENAYKPSGITLIRSQNVHDFSFEPDGLVYLDKEQADSLSNVDVKENDILLNITGESVTRCCLVPKSYLPARVNQHVSIIRPINTLADYSFIFYYLHSIKPELNSLAEIGCTRRALTKVMLEELPVPLPSLPEQRAIAAVLSCLDDKIGLLNRQNITLEGLAETLWRKMFVEDADTLWKKGKLSDICSKITKGTTPTTLKKDYVDNGINFIKVESITDAGYFIPEKFAYIDGDTNKLLSRSIVEENDIFYTIAGTIGRIAVATPEILPANTNQAIAIIRLKDATLFLNYIRLLLKTSNIINDMNSKIVFAVQPNLSLGMISETDMQIPDNRSLINFNRQSNSLFSKTRQNAIQIRTLSILRDSLLPKLMSGDVRVKM